MTFADAPIGSIVEIIDPTPTGKVASGRCYKKFANESDPWKDNAWIRFSDRRTRIHPTLEVRVIDPKTIDGF